MTDKQVQCLLVYLGYDTGGVDGIPGPKTRQAIRDFQEDFGGLSADGQAGEATQKALRHAVAYGHTKKDAHTPEAPSGTFWDEIQYFTREEFRCPCGKCGGYPVEPNEQLVREVDKMRKTFNVPVIIVPPDGHSGGSGVRCQAYNDSLKGSVPNSRHVFGKAVDFSAPGVPASTIEAYLARRQAAGAIRYWYRISSGSYHMDVA